MNWGLRILFQVPGAKVFAHSTPQWSRFHTTGLPFSSWVSKSTSTRGCPYSRAAWSSPIPHSVKNPSPAEHWHDVVGDPTVGNRHRNIPRSIPLTASTLNASGDAHRHTYRGVTGQDLLKRDPVVPACKPKLTPHPGVTPPPSPPRTATPSSHTRSTPAPASTSASPAPA